MTSQGYEMLRDAERVLPQLVTQWASYKVSLSGWKSGQVTNSHITNRQQDLHLFPRRLSPSKAPETPDIILLFKWKKSLIAMLMTFICENITNSLVYICVHL